MFCAYTRPRYQVSVYRTIGPLVIIIKDADVGICGFAWWRKAVESHGRWAATALPHVCTKNTA